jgi:hypothetical protein
MATDIIKRLILVAVVATIVHICYQIGRRDGRNEVISAVEERTDTLVVRDTIVEYEPVAEERVKLQKVLVPVEKTDTLWKHDTLLVFMEKEQVIWQDSLSKVYASGIMPEIDSVEHYISERVIVKNHLVPVVKRSRWGIGIHAGYGLPVGGHPAPYIGVGVSYNLLTW